MERSCPKCRFFGTFVRLGSEDAYHSDDDELIVGVTHHLECPACGYFFTDVEEIEPYEDDE